MASESIVVIAVRPGNPARIADWPDLGRGGVEVVTPNVRTSGGAMWNVLGVWGGARRSGRDGAAVLADVLRRVKVMDTSGRESILTFENGIGDAAITYEHEVLTARKSGKPMDYVVPPATVLIENPIAVVDTYAEKHGNEAIARAFVDHVFSERGQRALASTGLRTGDPAYTEPGLPSPSDLFTVEQLGGWSEVQRTVFAKDGVYDRAVAASQRPVGD